VSKQLRQRLLFGCFAAAVIVTAIAAIGAGGSGNGHYKVRAIFNNASFLIPGEDVKIAGAKVGKVDSLDVTPDLKAAAVLDITDPAFQDFRKDAECEIRLQSVIGEKLVDCRPTQPRPEGTPLPPSLDKVPKGQPGAGEYLLPATNRDPGHRGPHPERDEAALPAAVRDHPERVRRGPGGSRSRHPQGGPRRGSRTARVRPCDRDPGETEQGAR